MATNDEAPIAVKLKQSMVKELVEQTVLLAQKNKRMMALLRQMLTEGYAGYANMPIGIVTRIYTEMLGEKAYCQLLESHMVTHLNFNVLGEEPESEDVQKKLPEE